MKLLRSEQRSPAAETGGSYSDPRASIGPIAADSMTQRVDPRIGQPATRRPDGQVPLLPRQRPDEIPAPPMPENSRQGPDARNTGRPPFGAAPAAMPPRVAEPRTARVTPDPEAVIEGTLPDSAESTPPETTDSNGLAGWDLVRRTQAGDQEAFGQLYDRYHEMVFRYVLFRTSDRQLAEDLTAETFLRALRRIASVSYQGRDIGAWFVTIARNLVLDHVKSSRYRLEQTTSEIQDLSPSTTGPEQQVLDGATHEELLRCVAKLNSDQKECIALRFLQGLSVAETARLMGRNEGAVKALQHRAVRRLAQLLPEGLR
jgi:RNA polymerase sigma-70 factor (ECF subfamily)